MKQKQGKLSEIVSVLNEKYSEKIRKKRNEYDMMTLSEQINHTKRKYNITIAGLATLSLGLSIALPIYYTDKYEKIDNENLIVSSLNRNLAEENINLKSEITQVNLKNEAYSSLSGSIEFLKRNTLAIGGLADEVYNNIKFNDINLEDILYLQEFPSFATEKEYAIQIEKHNLTSYDLAYDFMMYPVNEPNRSYVSSPYGPRILSGDYNYHNGMDIVSKYDKNVLSMADGKVIVTGYDENLGNYLIIEHYDNISRPTQKVRVTYGHLELIQVVRGKTVSKGQEIGMIGTTGEMSSGDHIHLAFARYFRGKWLNHNPSKTSTYGPVY